MRNRVLLAAAFCVLVGGGLKSQASDSGSDKTCTPPLTSCKKPVKWITDKDECSCFACEYGTAKQHMGCTSNSNVKVSLLKLQNANDETELAADAPIKTLKGTIKVECDKMIFVNDADKKSWEVMNPQTLKGHEGHHVQVSAHVYADKDQIHVRGVKMMKKQKDKSQM